MTIVLLTKEFDITEEQSSRCGGFESYIWKDIRVRKSTKGKGCGKTHAKSREGLGGPHRGNRAVSSLCSGASEGLSVLGPRGDSLRDH